MFSRLKYLSIKPKRIEPKPKATKAKDKKTTRYKKRSCALFVEIEGDWDRLEISLSINFTLKKINIFQ
jgi:hypothetical protein